MKVTSVRKKGPIDSSLPSETHTPKILSFHDFKSLIILLPIILFLLQLFFLIQNCCSACTTIRNESHNINRRGISNLFQYKNCFFQISISILKSVSILNRRGISIQKLEMNPRIQYEIKSVFVDRKTVELKMSCYPRILSKKNRFNAT